MAAAMKIGLGTFSLLKKELSDDTPDPREWCDQYTTFVSCNPTMTTDQSMGILKSKIAKGRREDIVNIMQEEEFPYYRCR